MQSELTPQRAKDRYNNLESVMARQIWPTPNKTDFKGSSKPGQRKRQLTEALEPNNPGRLNPDWVELLMGFPPGWTSLPQDGLPPLAPHMHGNHQEPTPSNPETTNGCKL
jgi:hypothetical protein